MKKKVLLISQGFYPEIGSAGNRMKNIFQLLQHEGYQVKVLTTEPTYPNKKLYSDKSFWNDESLNDNIFIQRVKIKNRKYSRNIFNRLIYYLEMAFRLLLSVLKDKDNYHVIFVSSPPIFVGFVGLYAKFKYKSNLILDIRDLWPESLKGVGVFNNKIIIGFFGYLEKRLYKLSDHIIVNSMEFKSYIIEKTNVSSEKIGFMPNSARFREISNKSTVTEREKFKVIYTGNIGLAQDIEILKQLAIHLNNQDIELSIIGYGMKKNELVEFVKLHNLLNVHFYAPVTREECFKLNLEHDVGLVSLNDKEVFETVLPGKIIDYMTCGLPIVASVSGYAKKVIEKEKVGFVSESRNVKEIVDFILHLADHPELRNQMSNNQGRYIMDKFLWETNIKELINRIEDNEAKEKTLLGKVK
ncbi:glycosyl transferase group 1 protein [Mesobacillus campisalis]|uniref:Glycosyl transferase group 1 protein n=1 Tax=Mesobacillus campisalis TaxID=1408103 RepID=A0A0M2SW26_9BACI|nr:glycosyltransferase family 4 protein [Mesobacillus campisalis]KKK38779.1 glycosyl transferase group 1 protein [Mesobacillus campisalis]